MKKKITLVIFLAIIGAFAFVIFQVVQNPEMYQKETNSNSVSQDNSEYQDFQKYRAASQMLINELLNYPETAKYPAKSGWKYTNEGGTVILQSTVTTKNAFGAEAKLQFQVTWENGDPTSVILDGKEYIQ